MKKIFTLILQISIFGFSTYAQEFYAGAQQAGMAHSSVMNGGLWSIGHNQAGITDVKRTSVGLYTENAYFLNELGYRVLAGVMPTKTGHFGLSLSYFGFSLYNRTMLGLAYAKKLSKTLSVSVQLDYFYINTDGYTGAISVPAGEIGLRYMPIQNLNIGFHVFNPLPWKTDLLANDNLPQIYRVGMGYTFSEKLMLTMEGDFYSGNKPYLRTGLLFYVNKYFDICAGFNALTRSYSTGLSMKYKSVTADLAFSKHLILGYTPHFSVAYSF